jgi:uncharacterized membrane protein
MSSLAILFLFSCSGRPTYPEPPLRGADVVIAARELLQGNPSFFTFPYHGKTITFFVIKKGDRILSFLDACAKCYPSKLGYRPEGQHIVCRKCGTRYSVADIENGFGSCFPIKIEGRVQDGEYHIPVSLLEKEADKF